MTTLLPQDSNDNPIPALRLKSQSVHPPRVTRPPLTITPASSASIPIQPFT